LFLVLTNVFALSSEKIFGFSENFFLENPLTKNPLYDMIYLTNQTIPYQEEEER